MAVDRTRDEGDACGAPIVVAFDQERHVARPQHREVGISELRLRGQVQPDLEKLERVRRVVVEQREHLRVHDAATGREPLGIARAEARRGAQRVGVVDEAAPHVRDRLEAAVRVLREPGNVEAVTV